MSPAWFARLDAIASRGVIAGLMVLFLLLFLVAFPAVDGQLAGASGGVHMIDMQTSYTPEQVYAMVAAYGEGGRWLYILSTLTADLLYPLDYALLFALLIIASYRKAFPRSRLVRLFVLAPFVTAGFDLLENAGIITLLSAYPLNLALVAQLASLFTTLKWAGLAITMVLVLAGCVGLIVSSTKK